MNNLIADPVKLKHVPHTFIASEKDTTGRGCNTCGEDKSRYVHEPGRLLFCDGCRHTPGHVVIADPSQHRCQKDKAFVNANRTDAACQCPTCNA
jgi:hypothetical protein